MPKMEGAELARELAKLRPEISTLFMSGYTDHRLLELLPAGAQTRGAAEAAEPADPAGDNRRGDETFLLSSCLFPMPAHRLWLHDLNRLGMNLLLIQIACLPSAAQRLHQINRADHLLAE